MKVKQKLISLILSLTLAMGLATAPAFASSPDTSYFINSQRYYWSGASGTHELPSNTKLGNLVAMGIDFLSLDLAALNSSLSQLYSLVNTGLGTLNTTLTPITELKSGNWGSTLNLYAIPSGYGSSWYAQVLRGFYDIKDLNNSIKSLLYTSTGNQSTIINKLNSGITAILDSNIQGYIQNSSEQLTSMGGIIPGIKSDTSNLSKLIDINDALNEYNGNPWGFVWRPNVNSTPTLNYPLNDSLVPLIKFDNNKTQYQFTYGNKSIQDFMDIINKNLVATSSFIRGVYTDYPQSYYNFSTDSMINGHSATSVMDLLKYHFDFFHLYLGRITNIIADPQTIAAKKANASQEQTALNNFTGSGDASASASDFVGVKDSVSALKTSLSGGASYTQAFNILGGNSDGWSWFSQEVADSMDSTNSTRSLLRGNISSSTPYLDSYYDSIYSVIGIGGGVE